MKRYLLDRDVMSQLDQPDANRHPNVRRWLGSLPDNALFVSAIAVVEGWKGLIAVRRRAGDDLAKLRDADRYEVAFARLLEGLAGRIVPIDVSVAALWGRLLGLRDKNRFDACVAATALEHKMIVVTRNVTDYERLQTRLLNPFTLCPTIREPDGA